MDKKKKKQWDKQSSIPPLVKCYPTPTACTGVAARVAAGVAGRLFEVKNQAALLEQSPGSAHIPIVYFTSDRWNTNVTW